MNSVINSTMITINGHEYILVDVRNGLSNIGICPVTGKVVSEYERHDFQELFFVGDEPIIAVARNSPSDPYANKMISHIGSISRCDDAIRSRLSSAVEHYFSNSQSLLKSVQPILELLCDGLYIIHVGKMLQSDGAGNFFWNAYNIRHEVTGTADYNAVIGRENNYTPCFLIPSCSVSEYSEAILRIPIEKIKMGKRVGGISFQLSGMFSVLLSGHANATAALYQNAEFSSIIIEPIRNIMYESEESAIANEREPIPVALTCPAAKIPLSMVPEGMLENFFLQRRYKKPINYDLLKAKARRPIQHKGRRSIPDELYSRAEMLPDCRMIESANAIDSLSEEQIEALLNGETSYEGKEIVNSNYYNSIVVVCNYLQYSDFERFIDFALSIIGSPDLTAVHKYVVERLSTLMNSKIYRFFKTIRDNGEQVYADIIPLVEIYISKYDDIADRIQRESDRTQKIQSAFAERDKKNSAVGLAKMEQFIQSKPK